MATGSLMRVFVVGVSDSVGNPVAGGKVNTFAAGTATPLATYSDSALTVLNANPVILDSAGRATIYLQALGYKIRLDDSNDTVLWTQDNWKDIGLINLDAVDFNVAKSPEFDLDNGSGTTIDAVIMGLSKAVTISAARIIYTDATSGTVAAGSIKVGTTVGGVDIIAATNYANAQAVGQRQALTLASAAVAANTSLFVRHSGVAATQAGKAFVEIEFA